MENTIHNSRPQIQNKNLFSCVSKEYFLSAEIDNEIKLKFILEGGCYKIFSFQPHATA